MMKLLKVIIVLALLFVVIPVMSAVLYLCWDYASYIFAAVIILAVMMIIVALLFKCL